MEKVKQRANKREKIPKAKPRAVIRKVPKGMLVNDQKGKERAMARFVTYVAVVGILLVTVGKDKDKSGMLPQR
jgi:hypothetical protein